MEIFSLRSRILRFFRRKDQGVNLRTFQCKAWSVNLRVVSICVFWDRSIWRKISFILRTVHGPSVLVTVASYSRVTEKFESVYSVAVHDWFFRVWDDNYCRESLGLYEWNDSQRWTSVKDDKGLVVFQCVEKKCMAAHCAGSSDWTQCVLAARGPACPACWWD